MSIEVVGDGFFMDASQFNFLIATNTIFGFQKKRYDDDGHYKESCSVEGGILAILDLQNEEESQWEMSEFAAFDETPNSIDTLFTFQSKIYSLITQYTGGSQIQKLYEFKNKDSHGEFSEIVLDTPKSIDHEDDTIIKVVIADGILKEVGCSKNKTVIILYTASTYRIFTLFIDDDNDKAHVEYLTTIENPGTPLNAVVIKSHLFITYENQDHSIIRVELDTHTSKTLQISTPNGVPPFTSNTSHSTWFWSPMSLWGFTTGMDGTSFNGQSWAIQGLLTATPSWHRRDVTVPKEYGGYVLTDATYLDTYLIGKRQTVVVHNI